MKSTVSEIKTNVWGINSKVGEAENQANDLEHKEEKKHSIRTARRKKKLPPQKMRIR